MALNRRGYCLLCCLLFSLPAYAQSDEGKAAFEKHDYRAALLNWQPRAERGDASAQNGLGRIYFFGLGVSPDFEQGVHWFRKAADQNDPHAQQNLGLAYSLGYDDVAPDPEQARMWFRKAIEGYTSAAESGDVMAKFYLGNLYLKGQGVEPDGERSNFWFHEARDDYGKMAEQGNAHAEYMLGQMYLAGQGGDRDVDQAVIWLSKAAEEGDLNAQLSLGQIYSYEQYGHRDRDLAIKWLTKAAEQGDPYAEQSLSIVYAERARPGDPEMAAHWLREVLVTKALYLRADSPSETRGPTNSPSSSKN